MRKKHLAILLIVLLSISLVACGNNKVGKEPIEDKKEIEDDDPIIGDKKDDPELGEDIPKEYEAALEKADIYVNDLYLSKVAVYDQLVSKDGEDFSEEATQYAIENIGANWEKNALRSAERFSDDMDMSDSEVYDQLVSEYGGQFTEEEAQYAIENLE